MKKELNRRAFMRSSASVGAGLLLAKSAMAQSAAGEMKLGVIGTGIQGNNLISTVLKMESSTSLKFAALCDIYEQVNLSNTARMLGRVGQEPSTYTDHNEMVENEKLDAVIVATPDHWHAEHTIACLEAGVHVYCEAPMSNSVEDARRMARAAKGSGKLLQVGHQRRSNIRYIHSYENLLGAAKILGQLTAVNGQWNLPARSDIGWSRRKALDEATLAEYGYESMHQFKNWRWYKGLGSGLAVALGTHQLDVFNWFLGKTPKSVTAKGALNYYDSEGHQWYDTVMAIYGYETENGDLNAQYQSIASNGYGGYFEAFLGSEGSLEISESPSRGGIYRDPQGPKWEKWVNLGFLSKPGDDEEGEADTMTVSSTKPPTLYEIPVKMTEANHAPHLRNFFDAIAGNARLNCPADIAFRTTVSILAMNESIQQGQTVEFEPGDFEV
jgi:predicted dehydrogenase